VLPTVLRSKKKERKIKKKRINDDEKLLGPVCFIKLQVL